ncbi:MAG: hypothetical protein ACRCZ2_04490 [Fusobacteriaceae bacterium]
MALLNNYKKTEVKLVKTPKLKTQFDYSEFTDFEMETLVELEAKARYTGDLLRENLKELAEVFTQAQGIFANNKNGNFGKWYESLGFKKDFVYLCLDRKNLAVKYDKNKVYTLSDRAVKDLKKLDKSNETRVVYEVLESEKPSEKLKEIKEMDHMHIQYEQERISKKELFDRFHQVEKIIAKSDVKDKKTKIIELLNQIEDLLRN